MKVSIVTNMAPFVWGGAEEFVVTLATRLAAVRADVEVIRIPFYWEPYQRLETEIGLCRLLAIENSDLVIGMKFPAYHIQAKRKRIWLMHQFRQAYDLRERGLSNLPQTADGDYVRSFIVDEDNRTFGVSERLFSISNVVSDRLKRYNGFDAHVMRAPLNDAELFTGGKGEGYLLAAGRINDAKRQILLVEAMRLVPTGIRLVIAGPPDSNVDERNLRECVERYGLSDRITLDLRFMTRRELADYVNASAAVAYLPIEEDSFGYVTMEAFEAGKPVLTTQDAGEVTLLVRDGETGYVRAPEPEALAEALLRLVALPGKTRQMGQAGRELWRSLDIRWENHVARLLS